jgi:hypothetical protein
MMTERFLTIMTRHCVGREELLERNQRSLRRQSDPDFEQILIVDEVGRGLAWAEKQLEANRDRTSGCYVYILDDDDYLADDEFIKEAKRAASKFNPDVIMVRMRRLPYYPQVLPENGYWSKAPEMGHVGAPCYLVRRELWKAHIHRFSDAPYPGDFYFVRHLYDIGCSFYWLDRVVAEVDRVGHPGGASTSP